MKATKLATYKRFLEREGTGLVSFYTKRDFTLKLTKKSLKKSSDYGPLP